jgi:hypothetical protein
MILIPPWIWISGGGGYHDRRKFARDIQNRGSRRVGAKVVEDRLFKEYFGVSATVVLVVWNLLDEHDLIPEKGEIKHLLWTLVFLMIYPKQGPVCSLVGGTKGAVVPNFRSGNS